MKILYLSFLVFISVTLAGSWLPGDVLAQERAELGTYIEILQERAELGTYIEILEVLTEEIQLADDSVYVGETVNGVPHGQGTLTVQDRWKFVGEFKDGVPHGQGTSIFPNGSKYVGEFKNSMPDGNGTETRPGGYMYVGGFKDGKYHGHGRLTLRNGDKYVGELRNNNYHGQGTYSVVNGNVHVGIWKNSTLWTGTGYNKDGNVIATYTDGVERRETPTALGSGIVVNQDHILTAAHVVNKCYRVTVEREGVHHELSIVDISARDDLGLLKSSTSYADTAVFRDATPISLGEAVVKLGYSPETFGWGWTTGVIHSLAGRNRAGGMDNNILLHDAPTAHGNSGGPVLDQSGHVVGITSGVRKRKKNAAVKSHAAEQLLLKNFVTYEKANSERILGFHEIAKEAKKFTVQVGCWQ